MSLISDPDYLIHALRLTYLRNIEDPYAFKLLSFHPRHVENPNVIASGLADVDRWPHLTMPATPKPPPSTIETPATANAANRLHQMSRAHSDDPRFAGASSLKYTTTIMGPSRTGLAGMRTTGRRASGPSTPMADGSKRIRADSNGNPPVATALQPPNSAAPDSPAIDPDIDMAQKQQHPPQETASKPADTPSANLVFAPFTRTAEVEARRRARIQARNALAGIRAQQEQERKRQSGGTGESSEDDEDDEMGTAQDDEFDPDLIHHSPGSDEGSLLSTISGSQPSAFPIQPRTSTMNGTNYSGALSPVAEPASPAESPTANGEEEGTYTEVTVHKPDPEKSNYTHPRLRADGPPVSNNRQSLRPRPPSLDLGTPRPGQQQGQGQGTPIDRNSLSFLRTSEADDMFARKPIPPPLKKQPTSNLSRMLASQSGMTDNPFTELYGAISGRGDSSAISLDIYFPHSKLPFKAVKLNVRRDATVEEVIGFGLWTYWEEKLEPKLDEGLGGDDDRQRPIRLSAVGWSLRIAEDDGEVDEDFPPPDRLRKISGFGFESFAICTATPPQIQQNQAAEVKITRRPSRIMVAKKKPLPPAEPTREAQSTLPVPVGGAVPGSTIPLGTLSGTLGAVPSSVGGTAQGPPVFLRICVPEDQDAVLRYTTIHVKSDWYLADVLEHICRRRRIHDWKNYALVSQAEKVIVPLDRTVASLGGATELMLLEASAIPQGLKPLGRSTDPNALISKRMSEVPNAQADAIKDFTDAYQSWVVHRKPAVMMSRMEYTLALDGDHIHIMPSTKGYMDNNKTTSYHINAIQNVRQSKKSRLNFKLDVGNKTYDFEAENVEAANSIVARIRDVVKAINPSRASTLRRSRRF